MSKEKLYVVSYRNVIKAESEEDAREIAYDNDLRDLVGLEVKKICNVDEKLAWLQNMYQASYYGSKVHTNGGSHITDMYTALQKLYQLRWEEELTIERLERMVQGIDIYYAEEEIDVEWEG